MIKKRDKLDSALKGVFFSGIFMAVLSSVPFAIQAEMIQGEVVAVKEDGRSFLFKRPVPSNPSLSEEFDVAVRPDTKFDNIQSLAELASGDEVAAEAEKGKESGVWEARTVKILKVKLHGDASVPLEPVRESSNGG